MSILIKGMEMPRPFDYLFVGETLGVICMVRNKTEDGDDVVWYPLIEIPPHGRLIDADAFIKRISELVRKAETDGFDLGAAWYKAFIRHIELAPTIIPADKEEING